MSRSGVFDTILDTIGDTPIVRLSKLGATAPADVYVKLEFLNPGGSHKARIAVNMIRAAEDEGRLVPGSGQTIIEPTGGNTGIGLAMAASLLGYDLVLIVPDDYSKAKRHVLRAYGADVRLADHRSGNNAHAVLAAELLSENPTWVLLNQQANPANPGAHSEATALEILDAFDGDAPCAIVAGVGTGGHLTGVGRVLKRRRPDCRIVATLPTGCSLREDRFVSHGIQGLAIGVVPMVLDPTLIDEEIQVSKAEAVDMMRRMMREEGIAAGLSSAANIVATLRYAQTLPPGSRVLTFAYDNVGDYVDELQASEMNNDC